MWKKLPLLFLLGFVCSTLSAAVEITDLGTLGGEWSEAYAMNDSGQVIGMSQTANGDDHAFLYSNGQMTDLYPLNSLRGMPMGINSAGQIAAGAVATDGRFYPAIYDHGNISVLGSLGGVLSNGFTGVATAINESGQVAGYSHIPTREWHAFLSDKGVMRDLGCTPNESGVCYSYAIDINDRGQIIGGIGGSDRAFLYENGMMTQIEPFYSSGGRAYGINNSGQIAGYYFKDGLGHGFLYSKGTFTDIVKAESPYTTAFSINESGQVVGGAFVREREACRMCDYRRHAILFENGVVTDLNTLLPAGSAWELVWAYAINNNGKIVGEGIIHGQTHAFLLELASPTAPVPRQRR